MSVAFRRDSDEEHLEPRFELPIPAGPNLVTARGLALITERIADLTDRIAAGGDPEVLTALKRDLRYWQNRQITAEQVVESLGDRVEFGTDVRFAFNGKSRTLRIVGDDEADPAAGLVSFNAPLCRAMLGAEPGDLVAFGGVADAIEVLEVTRISA